MDIAEIMCSGNFARLRHRWEMPMIWISFLITVGTIIFGIWISSFDEAALEARFGDLAETVSSAANYAALVLSLPIATFFIRFYLAAQAKANAIRVGPNQFPALWAMYNRLGEKMHMPKLPKLYVTNGDGVVNAYALSCNKRHKYIVLHAETVLALKTNPDIVEFVLAHEMAHHKLGHVSLWRQAIGFIPNLLIPLGITTTRAQEYSADRVAKSVCRHDESAMKLLAIGPWMTDEVNSESWLEQAVDDRNELFVRMVQVMSSHAVMSKRFKAMRDIDAEGFGKHGEMF